MALQEDLRAQIIKQFAADVVLITERDGNEYFACPTCKHQIMNNAQKCTSCEQNLKWDNIRHEEYKKAGMKTAVLKFDVPGDFVKSDCRRCPLSFIAKREGSNIYDCPLGMRNNCPLEVE